MIATVRAALDRLRRTEPALLRARYVQALALAGALGLTVPGVVDRWVGLGLAVFGFVAPWLQGRRTRADVWSAATVDELTELVATYPELADVAKAMVGQGISLPIVRQWLQHAGPQHRAPA
ncbi:hypothetical protein TEK04_19625 [Klenkia sp. LSe6-5]|uniref:Uncharacterized protein n=1 Tax=Klenkia sesuvii TaxID=3103137 RepID=A0ABU8DYM8_9ACTN